jgi:hypothetical protein
MGAVIVLDNRQKVPGRDETWLPLAVYHFILFRCLIQTQHNVTDMDERQTSGELIMLLLIQFVSSLYLLFCIFFAKWLIIGFAIARVENYALCRLTFFWIQVVCCVLYCVEIRWVHILCWMYMQQISARMSNSPDFSCFVLLRCTMRALWFEFSAVLHYFLNLKICIVCIIYCTS